MNAFYLFLGTIIFLSSCVTPIKRSKKYLEYHSFFRDSTLVFCDTSVIDENVYKWIFDCNTSYAPHCEPCSPDCRYVAIGFNFKFPKNTVAMGTGLFCLQNRRSYNYPFKSDEMTYFFNFKDIVVTDTSLYLKKTPYSKFKDVRSGEKGFHRSPLEGAEFVEIIFISDDTLKIRWIYTGGRFTGSTHGEIDDFINEEPSKPESFERVFKRVKR